MLVGLVRKRSKVQGGTYVKNKIGVCQKSIGEWKLLSLKNNPVPNTPRIGFKQESACFALCTSFSLMTWFTLECRVKSAYVGTNSQHLTLLLHCTGWCPQRFSKWTKFNEIFRVYSDNAAIFYVKISAETIHSKICYGPQRDPPHFQSFWIPTRFCAWYSQWHDQNLISLNFLCLSELSCKLLIFWTPTAMVLIMSLWIRGLKPGWNSKWLKMRGVTLRPIRNFWVNMFGWNFNIKNGSVIPGQLGFRWGGGGTLTTLGGVKIGG